LTVAKHRKDHKIDWTKVIFWFVFISLIGVIAYAIVRLFQASAGTITSFPRQRLKSDYVLMLVQGILGLVVMFLPSMLVHKLNFDLPQPAVIAYFIFIYCAIFLGETRAFYHRFPLWDDFLHFFSGGMLALLGFIIVDTLNKQKKIQVTLSPLFVALFAFCFALSIGALWEIWEFAFDSMLGLNMQRFTMESGETLIGRAALSDTMHDLIVDTVAAFGVSAVCYFALKAKSRKSSVID